MAEKKVEVKHGFLLVPAKLADDRHLLRFITVKKSDKGVQYDLFDLDRNLLQNHAGKLPAQGKTALFQLCSESLYKLEIEIEKKHGQQRAGMTLQQFMRPAFTRQLQERFEYLKPFASLVKWYHQVPNSKTGNMMTGPCTFSGYKPTLQFDMVMEQGLLTMYTIVTINGSNYDLLSFRRFEFLLESSGEYFLLSHKDYKTLQWLEEKNPAQYAHDANLYAREILSVLEENYAVQRNNLFEVKTIDVPPVKRILLSEISNSFLVLTPQWMYDGYTAEGPWKESFEVTSNGEAILVKRNKEEELAFKKTLEALHPNFPKQLNGYYYLSFADAQKKQWFLKTYHQLLEMNIELIGMDMLMHFRYSAHKPTTVMQVLQKTDEVLTAEFSLRFGNELVPLTELQKILIAGQRAVMLKDGALGILPEEWQSAYGTILRHSKIVNGNLEVPQWLSISQEDNAEQPTDLQSSISEDWWERWLLWQQDGPAIYPTPASIQANLRPYQQRGFEWLKLLSEVNAGACLADDMGLGKTLQTICFITDRLSSLQHGLALIVCPSSLIYNWQQELTKFAPHLRTYIHHGTARDRDNVSPAKTDVCITSYGTMRSDIEFLSTIRFDVAVVDESHNIKNPSAQITRAVNQLNAGSRVALSGTPVMNNTFDLYSQLEFLLPGMFGNREFFKREYADPIDRDGNEEKIATLQKLTAPFILRRTKEQVAKDLPEKTESVLWCNMGSGQQSMYDEIRDSIRSNLFFGIEKQGLGKSKLAVLQGIMKLKQVCSSPLLLPKEEQTAQYSVKTEVLLEELSKLGNHKVLVFSQFSSMLHLLADAFTSKGISYYLLEGSTPAKKRGEMVSAFQQEDNTTQVFLISLMAGNTGLTLTAADYVFLFDPWWNNAVQQQAIDRTHRIGQQKNVFAYKMICKNSIEEKIMQLQQRKATLSENLIGDNEGFVKELTKEDVEFLFG